jgi:hypothetical protein
MNVSINEENTGQVCVLIRYSRRVTVDEVANKLQICDGCAYEIIHERLSFLKVCARWVPKQLMKENRCSHVDIWNHHWNLYHEE